MLFDESRFAEPRDHFLAARLSFIMRLKFHEDEASKGTWTNTVQPVLFW
jgi:hypothetical protein